MEFFGKGSANGYNQLHLTPLYDILNKVYLEAVIQPEPHKDEIGALLELVFSIEPHENITEHIGRNLRPALC